MGTPLSLYRLCKNTGDLAKVDLVSLVSRKMRFLNVPRRNFPDTPMLNPSKHSSVSKARYSARRKSDLSAMAVGMLESRGRDALFLPHF